MINLYAKVMLMNKKVPIIGQKINDILLKLQNYSRIINVTYKTVTFDSLSKIGTKSILR